MSACSSSTSAVMLAHALETLSGLGWIALQQPLHAVDTVAERDQLLHNLVVQLARQAAALGLLGGAVRDSISVLAGQPLLGVRAQHVDRAPQIFDCRNIADWLTKRAQVALRHHLSAALQFPKRAGVCS